MRRVRRYARLSRPRARLTTPYDEDSNVGQHLAKAMNVILVSLTKKSRRYFGDQEP